MALFHAENGTFKGKINAFSKKGPNIALTFALSL